MAQGERTHENRENTPIRKIFCTTVLMPSRNAAYSKQKYIGRSAAATTISTPTIP